MAPSKERLRFCQRRRRLNFSHATDLEQRNGLRNTLHALWRVLSSAQPRKYVAGVAARFALTKSRRYNSNCRRIRAASRMKFGFRIIFVECCGAESLRTNSDKQSIKRLPRQFTSS